ncbi:hypothetical protein MTO96_019443 [Rhipicephalus appendiculatus]
MNVLSAGIVLGNYMLHSELFLLTAGVMDHWCRRPDSFTNLSVDEWKELAIPVDKNGEYSHCTIREPPDGGTKARVVRCSSWEYNYTQYGNNIVSAWNLVCDRLWLIDFARLVYAAACVIPMAAAILFADSIGRRTALFVTIPVVLISGVARAMPNDLQFFMIVRAIVSASTSALVPPAVALAADVSTTDKFPAYAVAISLLSSIIMPVRMFATHLAKTGWVAVQLILMIPTCLLVVLYFTVIESPMWLLATGNVKEAERVALRAAKINNTSAEVCHELMARQIADLRERGWQTVESSGLCSGRLRTCTVLMCCMWSALCFGYDTFVTKDGIPVGDVATCPELRPVSRCVCRHHSVCQALRFKKRRSRLGARFRFGVDRSLWYNVQRRANTEGYAGSPDEGSRQRVLHDLHCYESQIAPRCDALPWSCRYCRLLPIRGHTGSVYSTFNRRPERRDAAGHFGRLDVALRIRR